MNFEVKCKINNEEVTITISEQEADNIVEQLVLTKCVRQITKIIDTHYPDCRGLLKDSFLTVAKEIAYNFLDYVETEGVTPDGINDFFILEFCNQVLFPYSEIRNNFFEDDEQCYTIDCWKTKNVNEEGVVVARVYADKVIFVEEAAKQYYDVLVAIEECKEKFKRKDG